MPGVVRCASRVCASSTVRCFKTLQSAHNRPRRGHSDPVTPQAAANHSPSKETPFPTQPERRLRAWRVCTWCARGWSEAKPVIVSLLAGCTHAEGGVRTQFTLLPGLLVCTQHREDDAPVGRGRVWSHRGSAHVVDRAPNKALLRAKEAACVCKSHACSRAGATTHTLVRHFQVHNPHEQHRTSVCGGGAFSTCDETHFSANGGAPLEVTGSRSRNAGAAGSMCRKHGPARPDPPAHRHRRSGAGCKTQRAKNRTFHLPKARSHIFGDSNVGWGGEQQDRNPRAGRPRALLFRPSHVFHLHSRVWCMYPRRVRAYCVCGRPLARVPSRDASACDMGPKGTPPARRPRALLFRPSHVFHLHSRVWCMYPRHVRASCVCGRPLTPAAPA